MRMKIGLLSALSWNFSFISARFTGKLPTLSRNSFKSLKKISDFKMFHKGKAAMLAFFINMERHTRKVTYPRQQIKNKGHQSSVKKKKMWLTRNLLSKHVCFYNQERNVKNNQCYCFIYFFPFSYLVTLMWKWLWVLWLQRIISCTQWKIPSPFDL